MRHLSLVSLVAASLLSGCVEGTPGGSPSHIPLPSEASCPELFKWSGVTLGASTAQLVLPDGRAGRDIITVANRINSISVHSLSGRVAYAEEPRGRGQFRLNVQSDIGAPSKVLLTSPHMIHSLSWSPDGRCIACFVGDFTASVDWLLQQLYLVDIGAGTQPIIRAFGEATIYGSEMVNPDVMATQIVWSEDGQSLSWVDGDGTITRVAIDTGEREFLGKAERLFAFNKGAAIIARRRPWRIMRMLLDSKKEESEIATLGEVESVGIGIMIPDSPLLSVVVSERQPHQYMKNPWMPTLFVNLKSGEVCGRIGEPILGYLRASSVALCPSHVPLSEPVGGPSLSVLLRSGERRPSYESLDP